MTQPYVPPPPHGAWSDPQQPTAPHVVPFKSRPRVAWTVIAAAALVAALASLTIQGLNIARSGSAADVSHLRSQITTLNRQHTQDMRTIGGLTQKVATLTNQYGTLSRKVGGMVPTVHNLAPFASGVCSQPLQGSKGAFTARFPCET